MQPSTTKLFEQLISMTEKEMSFIRSIINTSIEECNSISKNYKLMCDENKILKDILYNSYEKGISPKVKKLTNYHPLLMGKERNDKQINLMRLLYTKNSNNNLLDQFEGLFGLMFDFVDYIFCVRSSEKYINKFFNDHTLEAFRSLSHCIRLSVIGMIIFSVFNITSILNNSQFLSEYKGSFLTHGYLSFARLPGNNSIIFTYVTCLLAYITCIFCYVLFLLIQKYLSSSENNFIESNYPLAKFLFTSPTLSINEKSEKKYFHYYFLMESLNIIDNLYE